VVPFTGLSVPWGIAVDGAGNLYVSEHDSSQVLKLPAGSSTPTPLKLTGLNTPLQLATDSSGNVYVADRGNDRVIKLLVTGCPT
jgi:serine/threonine-protein kinase